MLLVLNAGSSSIKFALYDLPLSEKPSHEGHIAGIGRQTQFSVDGKPRPITQAISDHTAATTLLLEWLEKESRVGKLAGVGHRVVHGGSDFTQPVRLDSKSIEALAALNPLAPHHQPHNIAAIRAMAVRLPDLPQVACFDTAYHATMPQEASRLPLPADYETRGVRRYGFHGLSYESIVAKLPAIAGKLPARLIVAHLGNGASITAIKDGRSIATSMGFSTLDGLIMGTRSGSIDPGVLLHFLREGRSLGEIEDLLYNRSGVLGLSGISADMKTLLESPAPRASTAISLYCYRINREIGSLAAALGGLDALVFTGGIGENAGPVRAIVCRAAAWLGIALDEKANAAGGPQLTLADSAVSAWAIATDEQGVIARHTARLLGL